MAVCAQVTRSITFSSMQQLIGPNSLRRSTPEAYRKLREIVCTFERFGILGNDIELTSRENEANNLIMCIKMEEYKKGIKNPSQFVPGYHIFETLGDIQKSPLFKLIRQMPKGGALQSYDSSMCNTAFLIKLTYKKHLWVYSTENGCKIRQFRFSKEMPKKANCDGGEWETMEQFRERRGEENVNKILKRIFSMYPLKPHSSNDSAWKQLDRIFMVIDGLLRYQPVWAEYYYNALKEFNDDGVQYVETRSVLRRLYTLDGKLLPVKETVQTFIDQLKRFKNDHPEFIGSKLIYAPLRDINSEKLAKHVELCAKLNKDYPDFLIGFDIVGKEDVGFPLHKFANVLLKLPSHIDFFFHAGQTNWYGSVVDENLIDAVLLGTRRIGHAFAVTKHPLVMAWIKKFRIAIEVCPICNQVLQLGADYRNHPAATLIANDIPFVLSSGNPSFWRTTPLSHDFYMTFFGIAPMNADLKFLKRLVKNSIKYSALTDEEKADAIQKWKIEWEEWIEWIIAKKSEILADNSMPEE